MVVPVSRVVPWLCLAACIESNRPRFVTDAADADVPGDVADTAGDAEVGPDVDDDVGDVEGRCFNDDDCPAAASACARVTCESNACVTAQRGDGEGCDDGDPCTGDGTCRMGDCQPGGKVVDGQPCDDGLACNGVRTCQDGTCAFALPPTCPDTANPCAVGMECSEELAGQCVDVPAEDGLACDGPGDLPEGVVWQCSAGACVPPEMVFVGGGVFTMGCPEGYCGLDNGPAHEVRLSPFAIDRTEVSEAAFRRCRDDADARGVTCAPRPNEEEPEVVEAQDDDPARWIDWSRAAAVCAYEGKRLCSEAEWELAARGSGTAFYPWGNLPPTCERVVFEEDGAPGCGTNGPFAVGSKPKGASAFGALDMAGNVIEWVEDFYVRELYAARNGTVPLDPVQTSDEAGSNAHVVRGGSFRDGIAPLRVFVRFAENSEVFDDHVGTRCCLSLDGAVVPLSASGAP